MSRKKQAKQREILPDAKFGSVVLAKLINYFMWDGKKSKAEDIVYTALDKFSKEVGVDPIEGFDKVISNLSPLVEVRSRRVGGATYQVPVEVRAKRKLMLALRWLVGAVRSAKGVETYKSLVQELVDAFHGRGRAIKKKDETHKMADSNRTFAHYQW